MQLHLAAKFKSALPNILNMTKLMILLHRKKLGQLGAVGYY